MSMALKKPFLRLLFLVAAAALISTGVAGYANLLFAKASSCVACHLDQARLEETASAVKAGGSALQSGAG